MGNISHNTSVRVISQEAHLVMKDQDTVALRSAGQP